MADGLRRALFYGDSNTYGTDPAGGRGAGARYGPEVRWTDALSRALAGRWQVLADGRPGRCIPEMDFEREDFRRALAQAAPIELLAVLLGANDHMSAPRPDAGKVGERLERFLSWAGSACAGELAGTRVLVVAPPYLDFGADRFYGPYSTLDGSLSAALAAAAARAGAAFLDAGAWGAPLTGDGIHLAPTGHAVFARHMLAYMQTL